MLKKITTAYRRVFPKKHNTLNEAIKATPDYTKTEASFVKYKKHYYDISLKRSERETGRTEKFMKNKTARNIHTHVFESPWKELPSGKDITQAIVDFIRYKKDFRAISIMDIKNKEE